MLVNAAVSALIHAALNVATARTVSSAVTSEGREGALFETPSAGSARVIAIVGD